MKLVCKMLQNIYASLKAPRHQLCFPEVTGSPERHMPRLPAGPGGPLQHTLQGLADPSGPTLGALPQGFSSGVRAGGRVTTAPESEPNLVYVRLPGKGARCHWILKGAGGSRSITHTQ